MREWTRAKGQLRCGRCARLIRPGEPLVEIRVGTMKRTLKRCAACERVTDDASPPGGAAP